MNNPKILVTGATGKTGAAVVAQLREKNWPVRAIVRTRDARSDRLERMGAETVVADLYDSEHLLAAMRGTTRAYYCPPFQPYMIESANAFAAAAREARLELIVALSQWLASPAHPSLLTRQSWLAEQLFAMVPAAALTVVNPGYFADNYLGWGMLEMAAHLGLYPLLTGNSRNAPPSNEDVARVAVVALLDPATYAGKRYRPTGPALLSAPEMIDIMGKVLGRKVHGMPMPLWMLTRSGRLNGATAFELSSLRYYIEDHKQGAFELGAPTNDVLEVTGHPAEDFEATVRRYAAAPLAQRTVGNFIRAFVEFMVTPLSPGYDLDRIDRQMKFSVPPKAMLAMQDDHWKAERGRQLARQTAQPARWSTAT
jgi:uncharacterized protein YbjT (DUF2867 family)